MKYLNKITLATMGVETRQAETIALEAEGKEVAICRAYGQVSKVTPKEGDLGPYLVFEGQFEAMNLITGEMARSDKLIVPSLAETCFNEVYQKGLAEAQKTAEKEPKNGQVFVTVGGDITTMMNPSAKKGGWKHKYGIAALVEPKGEDDLTRLAATFKKPKVLAAPKS